MSITIDESKWPIIVVTFSGTPNDEEFAAYLAKLTTCLQKKVPSAYVIDARHSPNPPTKHRKMQADWMKENKELIKDRSAGTAFVFSSAIFRFVLSAIFLIQTLPHPYIVVGTLEEALDWAQKQLRQQAMSPDPTAPR
jgi:hypothetical protein